MGISQPPDGVVTRRHFLRIAGAAGVTIAAGGLLSACGSAPGTATGGAPSAKPVGGPLGLLSWAGYEGPEVEQMQQFWAESGIDLNFRALTNENLVTVMKGPGRTQWDAYTVNQGENNYYWEQGILSEVTVDEVPNLATMYPAMRDNPIWKVRDGVYNSVPWTIGPIGINYVKGRTRDITSWNEVLDPEWTGKVGTWDNGLNMISIATCAVELDPGKLTREQLNGPVRDWLVRLRKQLRVISPSLGDSLTTLVAGDVDIQLFGLLWNVPQGKEQGSDVVFVFPSEGTFGFVDAIGVTPWAENRQNAIAYCNAAMTPVTAAPLNASIVGIGPTEEINAAIEPAVRDLYPADIENDFFGVMKWNVSHYDPDGEYATIDEWDALWNEVKSG